MNDAIKLRRLRERAQLSQSMAATLSGVGEKTLSSFETGARIESIKVEQLRKLLDVYGVSMSAYFSEDDE